MIRVSARSPCSACGPPAPRNARLRDSLQGGAPAGLGVGDLRGLARTAEDVFARRLEQIAGVASVAVVGAPADEIRVDVDPDRLRALALTPEDVAQAIRAQNATGAGGTVRRGQFRFSVRALTEFRDTDEILAVPIGAPGSGITLRDVATVTTTLADPLTITRLDGREAIGLVVYKDAGSNTVAVTNRMMEAVEALEAEFPAVELTVVAAQADFVVDALSNLGQEIVVGGLMSLLMILLFLRDWRVSLAIGLMVPLSVMVALVTLQLLGVTINVLSLGGLALGTGILVDTAIVVAEGVGRRREEGMGYIDAAIIGTEEVSGPLLAGTLTTMLVFGPIIFVRGLAAALFRDLSLSVVMTVGASLLLSLTLMPVMMVGRRRRALQRQANPVPARAAGPTARRLDAIGRRLGDLYEHGMEWSLRHPGLVFAGGGVLLVVMVVLVAAAAEGSAAARGRRGAGGRGAAAGRHRDRGHHPCHRHDRTRGRRARGASACMPASGVPPTRRFSPAPTRARRPPRSSSCPCRRARAPHALPSRCERPCRNSWRRARSPSTSRGSRSSAR